MQYAVVMGKSRKCQSLPIPNTFGSEIKFRIIIRIHCTAQNFGGL